jgi:drug/metabolite transporter (DMT)-like permease
LPVGTIQACTAAVSVLVSGTVLFCYPDPECAFPVRFWTMASIFGSGFFNYFVLQLMGKAMKSGPNGIVWAIVQSALVFPFLVGVIAFGVALTLPRIGGILAIIAALALFGFARENRVHGDAWRAAAIGSLLLAGINQNLSNLPSYFPEAAAVGSVSRSLSAALGTFTAFLLVNWKTLPLRFGDLANPMLWRFTACLAGSGLAAGYFLLYRGLNLVAGAGAGAVSYPVLVSSCIASFTLYSLFILKEKMKPLQFGGLGLALVGIVLITLKFRP